MHILGQNSDQQQRVSDLRLDPSERAAASDTLDHVIAMSDFAGVIRSHPDYQAPGAMLDAIRAVLMAHGERPAGA